MSLHKEVLYDVEWQSLRVSLLGYFTTPGGVDRNVKKLQEYLNTVDVVRYWRVLNLLNAVRMGYHGQKVAGTEQDKKVIAYRDHVQELYHICKDNFPTSWDWSKVEKDLQDLYVKDNETFEKIWANLSLRRKNAAKRPHEMKRDELKFFLNLMQKAKES